MRVMPKAALSILVVLALAGCKRGTAEGFAGDPGHGRGRYAGIGIYAPAAPWTRMVAAQQANETPAAKAVDDQAIIVVVDSATGEVRSCGDMTGYCVGMNPWKTPLAAAQLAPINLTEHVKPIDTAADAVAAPSGPKASSRRSKVAQSTEPQ